MIYYKTEEEIKLIKDSSLLVAKTHAEIAKYIKPGVTSIFLDKIAEEFINDNGGKPAFKGYNKFPNTLCVSPNEEVVHGIPNDKPIKSGTVLSVDCGVLKNGFYGDSAFTYEVGETKEDFKNLLKVTRDSLYKGIEQALIGNTIGDIAFAIQSHVENNGYSVVRELVGHGIGRNLHESPEVPNYGKRGKGLKLKSGLVLAIEPMVNYGNKDIFQLSDGWTIKTRDMLPSAHFEHTVLVKNDEAEILSSFDYVDKVLNN
jgi:methionyl aminopeptidase